MVFRIFCRYNYRQRQTTGIKLQYTITVLPGFLRPYSRIPTHILFAACQLYATTRCSYLEAAFSMHCTSALSFRLYWIRFRRKYNVFFLAFVQQIIHITGQLPDTFDRYFPTPRDAPSRKWRKLCALGRQLINAYHRLPNTSPPDNKQTVCWIACMIRIFLLPSGP